MVRCADMRRHCGRLRDTACRSTVLCGYWELEAQLRICCGHGDSPRFRAVSRARLVCRAVQIVLKRSTKCFLLSIRMTCSREADHMRAYEGPRVLGNHQEPSGMHFATLKSNSAGFTKRDFFHEKHVFWDTSFVTGLMWSASQISFYVFILSGKKSSGHLITFKSSSSKYKVFPGSIAMDFIFEFAIIGGVFAKLHLINTSVRPMIALFSYVNHNGKYKETRYGILYSYCDLHRKSQQ